MHALHLLVDESFPSDTLFFAVKNWKRNSSPNSQSIVGKKNGSYTSLNQPSTFFCNQCDS